MLINFAWQLERQGNAVVSVIRWLLDNRAGIFDISGTFQQRGKVKERFGMCRPNFFNGRKKPAKYQVVNELLTDIVYL